MTFSENTYSNKSPLVDFSSEWCLPCMNNTEHFYEVSLNWQSGRIGMLHSSELTTSVQVATPPEFPNGIQGIWSPEHLLLAAVNSCLMTTFLSVSENAALEFINFESKAIGKLEMVDGKYMISEITLTPVLSISDELNSNRAKLLLQKSEDNCLIANSTKSKIIFKPEIKIIN